MVRYNAFGDGTLGLFVANVGDSEPHYDPTTAFKQNIWDLSGFQTWAEQDLEWIDGARKAKLGPYGYFAKQAPNQLKTFSNPAQGEFFKCYKGAGTDYGSNSPYYYQGTQ